ncbi:type II toxin-antitoxin system RelE family toxin [Pseudomonas sp.]|uniref:type II toxin-antitoxin system RelE family toxin n=1 Tax=Pseudomonas sp. TaxID=306 RepID=UPI003CC6DB19
MRDNRAPWRWDVHGEPDKTGKPLRGSLAGCRRNRAGDTRIVYRVDGQAIIVLIIVVGARRDSEVYDAAAADYFL